MNRLSIVIVYPLCAILVFAAAGCTIIGALAGKVVPPPMIQPKYTGLKDQSVSIMVWAGDGTLIDFPDVRLDLAGSLQTKLQQAMDVKTKSLAGMTFPVTTASVVRYQDNHPENDAKSLTEIAPKLKTSRVIYVELENLQTRSNASVELYRGSGSATMKIVEVPQDGGPATIAYEESGIEAVFPPKAREEGTPAGNDFVIYRGTVDALTTEIAKRFVPYQEEQ